MEFVPSEKKNNNYDTGKTNGKTHKIYGVHLLL